MREQLKHRLVMPWDTSEAESARERTRVIMYINEVADTAAAAAAAQLREGEREGVSAS